MRRGRTLVLGKGSRNLCPGGLAYLGFKKPMSGMKYYISTGVKNEEGKVVIQGEGFFKTPEHGEALYASIPWFKNPSKYAVFMPLDQVKDYEPELVIFFVKMDQLGGLVQLANYDLLEKKTTLGVGSSCSTIITEPYSELKKEETPRAVVGMFTDILSRSHIKTDEASFTVGYKRLIQMYENIEGSFLELGAWKNIQTRME